LLCAAISLVKAKGPNWFLYDSQENEKERKKKRKKSSVVTHTLKKTELKKS
jgi:hypothetical protein